MFTQKCKYAKLGHLSSLCLIFSDFLFFLVFSERWCYLNETRNLVFSRGLANYKSFECKRYTFRPKIRVSWPIWWALTFYDGLTHHWSFGHFHLINIFPHLLLFSNNIYLGLGTLGKYCKVCISQGNCNLKDVDRGYFLAPLK